MPVLPPITELPYTSSMKPMDSAKTSATIEADGRLRLAIEHDIMAGITPAMLDWWFRHIEGDVVIEGIRCSRYTAWHPKDHVAYAVHERADDGAVGVGSVFHICEVFGRTPGFEVDVLTNVTRLDIGGFAHRPRFPFGLPLAQMDYEWEEAPGGTRYKNSLTVGIPGGGRIARLFNERLRPRFFSDAKGRAWLLHNIEEVGNLEHFLPALVRQQ